MKVELAKAVQQFATWLWVFMKDLLLSTFCFFIIIFIYFILKRKTAIKEMLVVKFAQRED